MSTVDLEPEVRAAAEVVRAAVQRLLDAGELDARAVAAAVAMVSGELAAVSAAAGVDTPERSIERHLDIARHAAREWHGRLDVAGLPVVGTA